MTEINASEQAKTILTEAERDAARSYFRINDVLVTPPIRRAAYSDRMAWIMASMADLAYDRFEDDAKACELFTLKLKGGGFRLIQIFNSDATDTQAFLAANGDFAVLAFRGTEVKKKKDVLTDLRATQIASIEGGVHKGFQGAYDSVKDEIEKNLATLDEKLPIYITGHSLGADSIEK